MKYIKFLFRKNLLFTISLLLISSVAVFAAPPGTPYTANETLDPSCAPGDTNCIVQLSAGSDNLWNHTMTGNLLTNGNWLSNDGGNEWVFITSTWSVGVWSSTPFQPLTVAWNIAAFNYYAYDQAPTNAGTVWFGNGNGPWIEYWGNSSWQTWSLIFKTNTSERMRINQSGNVGIGTTSPTEKLQVQFWNIALSDAYELKWWNSSIYWYNGAGWYINFKPNNVQSLYLNDSGNVGIWTISPARKLDVSGSSRITGDSGSTALQLQPAANTWGMTIDGTSTASQSYGLRINAWTNSSDTPFQVKDAAQTTDLMTILWNGTVGIWTSSPSAKLDIAGNLFFSAANPVINFNLWGPTISVPAASTLAFSTSSSEKMRIDPNGNVGIGITPVGTAKISLHGALRFTNDNSSASDIYTGIGAVGTDIIWIATAGTERMRIDSAGSVGIWTTSPIAKLEVKSAADSRWITLSSTSGNSPFYETYAWWAAANQKIWRWWSIASNGYFILQTVNDGYTGAIDRMSISPIGEVTTNGWILYVWNANGTQDTRVEVWASTTWNHNSYVDLVWDTTYGDYGARFIRGAGVGGDTSLIHQGTGSLLITTLASAPIRFYTNNLQRAVINTSGTLTLNTYGAGTLTTDASGNVTASSDERLKDVKWKFIRGLSDIIKITPITYKWNKESGLDQTEEYSWFSAQDIQKAIPEAVWTDDRGYLSLSDRPILATLVNAIKELYTQLTSNDEDIAALKKIIELQQKQIDYLMSQAK
jgi:hypothetical protein